MWLAAAAAFNLVCSGIVSQSGVPDRAFSKTIRVDIAKGKWCEDDCRFVRELFDVQPTVILFRKQEATVDNGQTTDFFAVNRETGKYVSGYTTRRGRSYFTISENGECTRAEFTNFPEFKTKF